jgi:zinc/manganese transport system substrate-binding protein
MRCTTIRPLICIVGLLALPASACGTEASDGGSSGAADGQPVVVATTSVLGDVVQETLGDSVEVDVLMPRGTDPHAFEPSARDIAGLREATLIVSNGLGLEGGLSDVLEQAAADGVPVLEVAPEMDPLPLAPGGHDHDHDEGDHGGDDHDEGDELDPHVWFDPSRMASAVPLIAEAYLAEVPDADADVVQASADDYAARLRELDQEVERILDEVPDDARYLVTNHGTFAYLADRYGFEVIGVVLPGGDTLAAPSAAALESLATEIDEHGVFAIFTDNTVSGDLAEVLAGETDTDVAVVGLFTDSLGEPDGPAATYVDMLLTNATRITGALG